MGRDSKNAGGILTVLSNAGLFALSVFTAVAFGGNSAAIFFKVGRYPPPLGITVTVDALSAFMLLISNLVAMMIAIYAVDYTRKFTDTWKFYTLFSIMTAGINGILIAGDIFNMYVFLEISAISAYFLVAFGTQAEELEAAFKYAVMGSVASIFILLGIAFLYSYTSTLNMADIARTIASKGMAKVVVFAGVLFLGGFGLKAALAPFHAWLPYAHSSAPAPISAMLSGILIKVLGLYAIMRLAFNVFGMSPLLSQIILALAVVSMILGAVTAFGQTDIKRLFAYSSISQVGYIALGLGIGTPLAILGALFHLLNHSIFKSLLFLNAGAIETLTGTRNLEKIRGVAKLSPITGYSSIIASLSISGVPPLGGFWSKLIIIFACIQANRPILALIAAAVSALTIAYYFRAITPMVFGARHSTCEVPQKRISPYMTVPMGILAVLVLLSAFVLLPSLPGALLKNASAVVTSGKAYLPSASGVTR